MLVSIGLLEKDRVTKDKEVKRGSNTSSRSIKGTLSTNQTLWEGKTEKSSQRLPSSLREGRLWSVLHNRPNSLIHQQSTYVALSLSLSWH